MARFPTAPRSHGSPIAVRTNVDVTHLGGADAEEQFSRDTDLSVDVSPDFEASLEPEDTVPNRGMG